MSFFNRNHRFEKKKKEKEQEEEEPCATILMGGFFCLFGQANSSELATNFLSLSLVPLGTTIDRFGDVMADGTDRISDWDQCFGFGRVL